MANYFGSAILTKLITLASTVTTLQVEEAYSKTQSCEHNVAQTSCPNRDVAQLHIWHFQNPHNKKHPGKTYNIYFIQIGKASEKI
jgi:hypothetical protein